jgi:hypothetical protein
MFRAKALRQELVEVHIGALHVNAFFSITALVVNGNILIF